MSWCVCKDDSHCYNNTPFEPHKCDRINNNYDACMPKMHAFQPSISIALDIGYWIRVEFNGTLVFMWISSINPKES